jgi:hypothetical protein
VNVTISAAGTPPRRWSRRWPTGTAQHPAERTQLPVGRCRAEDGERQTIGLVEANPSDRGKPRERILLCELLKAGHDPLGDLVLLHAKERTSTTREGGITVRSAARAVRERDRSDATQMPQY